MIQILQLATNASSLFMDFYASMQNAMQITGFGFTIPLVTAVISAFFFFKSFSNRNGYNDNTKFLKRVTFGALFIWSIGWGLYMVIIASNSNLNAGKIEQVFRSAFSALGLFGFGIDNNVFDGSSQVESFREILFVLAFFAGICTISIVVLLSFQRLAAFIKMLWAAHICRGRKQIYLFWGYNKRSEILAESIRKKHKENNDNKGYWIIYAEPHLLADSEEDSGIREIITKLFTHKSGTLNEGKKKNTLIAIANTDLNKLHLQNETQPANTTPENTTEDILDIIGIGNVKKIANKRKGQMHVFFFTDNQEYNLTCARQLADDTTVNSKNTTLYCMARKNTMSETIANSLFVKKDIEMILVDPSNISIEGLKRDIKHHPVQLVDIDPNNPTTVKSKLTSLIIGFDATGRDALRYLYEFGAFVDHSSVEKNVVRSPFYCKVLDKNMNLKSAQFKITAPAAVEAKNTNGQPLIEFEECDSHSNEFFINTIAPIVEDINIIFITIGDNERAAALAAKLFRFIRQHRKNGNLDKLRIFVRCSSTQNEDLIQQIADYYNEGYNTDKETKEYLNKIIIPFGTEKEIFSYNQIIDPKFREQGKLYQNAYAKLRGEKEEWDLRRCLLSGKKKEENGVIGDIPAAKRTVNLNNLTSLRRKEQQDEENALHAATKLHLLEQALKEKNKNISDLAKNYFIFDNKGKISSVNSTTKEFKTTYKDLSNDENKIILNLAMLEHLRWNASHELLGYTRRDNGTSCDERTMQHNCLVAWEKLDLASATTSKAEGWDADYKSFDFGVIDTSIKMHCFPQSDGDSANKGGIR